MSNVGAGAGVRAGAGVGAVVGGGAIEDGAGISSLAFKWTSRKPLSSSTTACEREFDFFVRTPLNAIESHFT